MPLRGKWILIMGGERPGAPGPQEVRRPARHRRRDARRSVALAADPVEALAILSSVKIDAAVLDLDGNPPVSTLLGALRNTGAPVAVVSGPPQGTGGRPDLSGAFGSGPPSSRTMRSASPLERR